MYLCAHVVELGGLAGLESLSIRMGQRGKVYTVSVYGSRIEGEKTIFG
jgi:hypothetical protein